jgi:hypothetical protein
MFRLAQDNANDAEKRLDVDQNPQYGPWHWNRRRVRHGDQGNNRFGTSGMWIPNQLIQAPQRLLQESFYGIRQSVSDQADTAIA